MTPEEIKTLDNILAKAVIKSGLYADAWIDTNVTHTHQSLWIHVKDKDDAEESMDYQALIFSHSFAKAFWGEEIISDIIWFDGVEADDRSMPAWQWHLQQMVIEKEPLKYLKEFL